MGGEKGKDGTIDVRRYEEEDHRPRIPSDGAHVAVPHPRCHAIGKLLNRGYEVVRVDLMPGVPGHEGGNVGECAIPPALVYVLRRERASEHVVP